MASVARAAAEATEASGAEAEEDGDPLAAAEGGETAETEEAAVLMEDKKHISTEN